MTTIQLPFPREWSVDDLISHLGVPANRIRLTPLPGTAVEEDVPQPLPSHRFISRTISSMIASSE